MEDKRTLLLLEDEPLILIDLQSAAEDLGCHALAASTCDAALALIHEHHELIDAAILDVSLGGSRTCLPVADALDRLRIPYVLHSGDLDRHNERIRQLKAELIPKPADAERVISAAMIVCGETAGNDATRFAPE